MRSSWELLIGVAISACSSIEPAAGYSTGFDRERPLASLSDGEIQADCVRSQEYYAEAVPGGPTAQLCTLRALYGDPASTDEASCIMARDACVEENGPRVPEIEALCAMAHDVDECPADVTVAVYEDCFNASLEVYAMLDCSLAGDTEELNRIQSAFVVPGCEALNDRRCSFFLPEE